MRVDDDAAGRREHTLDLCGEEEDVVVGSLAEVEEAQRFALGCLVCDLESSAYTTAS